MTATDEPEQPPEPLSYADAGVDRDAADSSVAELADILGATSRPEVIGGHGGFAGLFALRTDRMRDPVLVSSTDGVGTKLELARRLGRLDTVGIDLVAMVVDDLVVAGAEPLFFLDYLSVGRLEPERVAAVVRGIAEGCRSAGCALLGGETAEHPGVLPEDALDLAGFGVGAVERDDLLGDHRVREGDAIVAMASSGLHSNGFSLVRRIVEGLDPEEDHGLGRPLGEVLLEPTRIYASDCLVLADAVGLRALAHVTGGGIAGNLSRVLPGDLGAELRPWSWPPVFSWLAERGPVTRDEMLRTFNCGVGMLAVVAPGDADDAVGVLEERGVTSWVAGEVVAEAGISLPGT